MTKLFAELHADTSASVSSVPRWLTLYPTVILVSKLFGGSIRETIERPAGLIVEKQDAEPDFGREKDKDYGA